jgi:hypothetical protein
MSRAGANAGKKHKKSPPSEKKKFFSNESYS